MKKKNKIPLFDEFYGYPNFYIREKDKREIYFLQIFHFSYDTIKFFVQISLWKIKSSYAWFITEK